VGTEATVRSLARSQCWAGVSLAGHLSLNQVTVITDLLRAKDLVLLGSLERMVSGYL